MESILNEIGRKFKIAGKLDSYSVITTGNINATYKVTYMQDDGSRESYLFQRINTYVFKNPVAIMENIGRVTEYINERYPEQTILHYYQTDEGINFCICDDNAFWRVVNYVDAITFDTMEDLSAIEAMGKAFGQFQRQLFDFDGSVLHETIPEFHNTKKRLDTLVAHVKEDPCGRAAEVEKEIEYLSSVRERAAELSIRFKNGEIPKRVTHNDTKCNNVLFDRVTKEPITVIDLDTVMPGMSIYDFADAARFIANTAEEDEADINKVSINTMKFCALAKGFLSMTKDVLEQIEIDNLVKATFSITVEQASRFLDDYITGDKYFKCNYAGHNLVRARCQIHLAKDIERKWDELAQLISNITNNI